MIQTTIQDGRGEDKQLTVNDLEYWNGPYRYEPYPKQLFRTTGPQEQDWEAKVVRSEDEHRKLGPAWAESPDEARAYQRKLDDDVARAAAEVQTSAQRMSSKAKAELQAADDAADEHVVDVKPARKSAQKRGKRIRPVVAQ